MDGDPAVEPELDTFSLILPLPYRVALILVLGNTTSLAAKFLCAAGEISLTLEQAFGHGASIYTTWPSAEL